ncbi:hypothetical protein Cgig2_033041 [Carnegiea gigantea]|uniref:Rho termination factor-like N-terminal domain-containing protein n=1 Tax=Carnegiea gigantea TaxID=171969 RepID=A0A9Q1QDH0_9CARY|nr:hypothetical protein Cgig2_033041 [Carnegiea gigantea]
MSPTLNLLSNNLQGVSGRAVSISSSPQSERRTLHMSVMSPKCCLRHRSFVCKASFGGQRRDSDFSRQNRHESSQSWIQQNEERDDSDDIGKFEFLSAKNARLPSLSNSEKHHATAPPGRREWEILQLFRNTQALLRERGAVKEEKRSEAGETQNEGSDEIVDPLLRILKKCELEKRRANRGVSNEFPADRKIPQQSRKLYEEKGKGFSESIRTVREEPQGKSIRTVREEPQGKSIRAVREEPQGKYIRTVREEPQETKRPSFSRPVSNFQRRSPIPRIRYEPIVSSEESFDSVSYSDLDEKSGETHSEPDLGAEAEFDFESYMDLTSEEEEEEEEEELETAVLSETDLVNGHAAEFSAAEEDNVDEREAEKQHPELKDLKAMKLDELREVARARGMRGYSKLKKSELLGLLSEDAI